MPNIQSNPEVGYNQDPIFLLSKDEFERYKESIPVAVCTHWGLRDITGHHHKEICMCHRTDIEDWDLRATVYNGSKGHPERCVINYPVWDGVYVRPALNLNYIDSSKYQKIDDNTIYCGKIIWNKFCCNAYIASTKIISSQRPYTKSLPIDITDEEYRKADSSVSYETSDIRRYLLSWYNKHIQ